ncbi:helix-turn-helix transcriptional regulator [Streptomyces sp. NBC_00249]|uniref:helix-turn-helix domain-containing protein n=1 Tax=Streptomyces sp. NBC_00249 TaxID=2975690 RepID=UPI00225A1B3D|nr:helix-turn-helix transcriptional regulator [Streptomyces sp. NBC_00249]MCX5193519.1 helix-turn-helix transcriptional regulator [Streptomyces sp. NBC_00249]
MPALRASEKQIYARACATGAVTVRDLEGETALSGGEIDTAIRSLQAMRLLRDAGQGEDQLIAVSPDSAKMQLLDPLLLEMRRLQEHADAMRVTYDSLVHVYEAAASERLQRKGIEVVPDPNDVRRAINSLAASATSEVLTSHPGGARPPEALHESVGRSRDLLERGVGIRTLYQHSAHFDVGTVSYVEHFTALGTQVRTLADGFPQVMIFDERRAVLPLRDQQGGTMIVSDPSMVDFVVATFERAWAAASPFPLEYKRQRVMETSEDVKLSIMRLLVNGDEDKRIAERLGISLRSCQRHVSQIMKRIGARSRLHAGYLISHHDLLNRPLPADPEKTGVEAGG